LFGEEMITTYKQECLEKAKARILRYDTLAPNKSDLQLWIDAKLMVEEINTLQEEADRLKMSISELVRSKGIEII
jgi:hypothetical protein